MAQVPGVMATGTDQTLSTPGVLRRVLLTGATSQIGVFAIPRLVKAGFQVLAVSRNGKPSRWPAVEQVEWFDVPGAMKAVGNCQYFLSAGPMELAQEFLSAGTQFKSAVIFSSSSVVSKVESNNRKEKDQVKAMLATESLLREQAAMRGVRLTLCKPTLIYGCGLDTNVSRLAAWIRRYGFIPVNGRAAGLRQPVHADDLAAVAVTALLSEKELPSDLFLAGGETLTYSEMLIRIFEASGKSPNLVHLPQWLFVLLITLVRTVKKNREINSEMARRQRLDLVFDDHPARALLGYDPRPFHPDEKDFSLPESS